MEDVISPPLFADCELWNYNLSIYNFSFVCTVNFLYLQDFTFYFWVRASDWQNNGKLNNRLSFKLDI